MLSVPEALKNRTLLAVSLAVGAGYTGIGMVVPVRVLFAQSRGASLAIIGAMASSYLISNLVFQYPVGWLADRAGRKSIMLAGFAGQAALTLSYLLITDPVLFVGLRFVEGIFGAAVLPPARALIADTVPNERRGEAYGVFGAFFNAGFLLGPAVGGLLGGFGYAPAFIGSVLCRIGAMALVALLVHEEEHRAARRLVRPDVPTRALFSPALLGAYVLAFGDYLWLGFDLTVGTLWLRHQLGATLVLIGLTYTAWSVPSMILSPFGGRVADRARRSTIILTFGLAQIPLFAAYGLIHSLGVIIALFVVQSALYSFLQPAADSYLAIASPPDARARAQSIGSASGLISAFLASTFLPAVYGIDYRLPFFVLDAIFGLCIVIGGTLVRRTERWGIVAPAGSLAPAAE